MKQQFTAYVAWYNRITTIFHCHEMGSTLPGTHTKFILVIGKTRGMYKGFGFPSDISKVLVVFEISRCIIAILTMALVLPILIATGTFSLYGRIKSTNQFDTCALKHGHIYLCQTFIEHTGYSPNGFSNQRMSLQQNKWSFRAPHL